MMTNDGTRPDEEWETLRKIVDPDGDSIEFDIVDSKTVDIAIKRGPREVCRLGLTSVQLDVLIELLIRIQQRMEVLGQALVELKPEGP